MDNPEIDNARALLSHADAQHRLQGAELALSLGDAALDVLFEGLGVDDKGRLHGDFLWSGESLRLFFGRTNANLRLEGDGTRDDLRALDLSSARLSPDRVGDLAFLTNLPALRHLNVEGVRVGEALDTLCRLEQLERIRVFGAVLTSGGDADQLHAALRKALPGCTVDTHGDAEVLLYCEDLAYEELHPKGLRVAAAALPVARDGVIERYYLLAYGYEGGGCQSDLFFRVDFMEDGTILARRSDTGFGEYFFGRRRSGGEWVEEELTEAQCEFDDTDSAIAMGLIDVLWENLFCEDGSDWVSIKEDVFNTLKVESGRRRWSASCGFNVLFYMGLVRGLSPLLTSWEDPEALDTLRTSLKGARGPWVSAFEKRPRTRFVLTQYVEAVEMADAETDEEKESVAASMKADATAAMKAITDHAGLEFICAFVDWQWDGYTAIAQGDGTLYDLDGVFLETTRTLDCGVAVTDIDNLLTQIYDYGDYDTGVISNPEGGDHYSSFAERVRDRMEVTLSEG